MNRLGYKKIQTPLMWLFIILTLGFLALMALNQSFFDWAFERHHNVLSWYIRPLIILPLCYFSYKRSGLGLSMTAFLGLTSMFWFPRPEFVDAQIEGFLEMEKAYLTSGWTFSKILISSFVPLTLYLLCFAFWKRSLKAGIGIIIAIAVLKTLWSVIAGGEAGMSVVLPAMVGLFICLFVIFFYMRRRKFRASQR